MIEQRITGLPPRDIGPALEASRNRLSWIVPLAALALAVIPLTLFKMW